jgi:sugar phosphate isomerase/epimerase
MAWKLKSLTDDTEFIFYCLMELGISTSFNYKIGLDKNLEAIARAGFQYVSLGGNVSHSGYNKPEGRQKIRDSLRKHNLRLDSLHAPFDPTCDLTQIEDVFAQSAMIEMKRAITAAAELETPYLVLHLSSFRPSKISERLTRIKTALPDLIAFAESKNVIVAMENLDYDSEVLFKFGMDLIDSKHLGFCYDNGHEMLYNGSMDLLKKYSHRLAVIHFHDNDGQKDSHLIPFDGKLNLPAFAGQLNKLETIPDITMECEMAYSHFGQTDSFLKAAYEAGKRFLSMLKH